MNIEFVVLILSGIKHSMNNITIVMEEDMKSMFSIQGFELNDFENWNVKSN